MRSSLVILLIFLGGSITASPQTTGAVTGNGLCNLANSGNNNTNLVINCGIGKEQGQQMLEILNKILANKLDLSAVMKQLNEIEALQKKAAQSGKAAAGGTADCPNNAGICTGVNNGTQQQFFGASRPAPQASFTLRPESPLKGMERSSPRAELVIRTAGDFQSPIFRIVCDGGCVPMSALLYTRIETFDFQSVVIPYKATPDPSEPNVFSVKFTVPSGSLEQGQSIILLLRSVSFDPVKVETVTSVTQ